MSALEFKVRFVASDNQTRARGLMHAKPLEENEAAVFIFPNAERHAFWNRNVTFPIDVAYLDDAMRIVDIQQLGAHQEEPVAPKREARFVIEAVHGLFERCGYGEGDLAVFANDQNTITLKRASTALQHPKK